MESPAHINKNASPLISYVLLVLAAVIAGLAGGMWYRSRTQTVKPVEKNLRSPGEEPQNPLEYAIKANHLYYFISSIHWPNPPKGKEFVLGIVGDDPFGADLTNRMKDAQIDGRPVRIAKFKTTGEIDCQMLFVSAKGAPPLADVIKSCSGKPIVTVGESKDFLTAGGMIQFELDDGHVKYHIEEEALHRAGLEFEPSLKRKSH